MDLIKTIEGVKLCNLQHWSEFNNVEYCRIVGKGYCYKMNEEQIISSIDKIRQAKSVDISLMNASFINDYINPAYKNVFELLNIRKIRLINCDFDLQPKTKKFLEMLSKNKTFREIEYTPHQNIKDEYFDILRSKLKIIKRTNIEDLLF